MIHAAVGLLVSAVYGLVMLFVGTAVATLEDTTKALAARQAETV
jgi:hypothetical protein